MGTLDEPTRLSGHLFVDAITAWNSLPQGDPKSVNLALERQAEIGAILVAPEGAMIRVDIDAVNRSAVIAMSWLVDELSAESGVDRESIAGRLREYLDTF
jgi:hypothetical protein